MEVGSPGMNIASSNSEGEINVFKAENKEHYAPPSTESIAGGVAPSAAMSRGDVPVADEAKGSTDAGVADPFLPFSFPALSGDMDVAGPLESTSPVLGKPETTQEEQQPNETQPQSEPSQQQNEPPQQQIELLQQDNEPPQQQIELSQQDNEPPQQENEHSRSVEQEDSFDDMVVLKDGMVTSASPSDRVLGDMLEALDAQMHNGAGLGFPSSGDNAAAAAPAGLPTEVSVEATVSVTTVNVTTVTVPAVDASLLESASGMAVDANGEMQDEGTDVQKPDTGVAAEPPSLGHLVKEHSLVSEQAGLPPSIPEAGVAADSNLQVSSEGNHTAEQAVAPSNSGQAQAEMPVASSHEVSAQDIQAIKGQKVLKTFGKKRYSGDVVDYDPETKWFKVVYEDGDHEDLEVWEVKAILASSVAQPSSSSKKRARSEGASDKKKSAKKAKNASRDSTSKKKAGTGKKSASKSPISSSAKGKSPKKVGSAKKSKNPGKSAAKSPKTPQSKKRAEGKAKAGTQTPKSHKGGSSKSKEVAEVSRTLDMQTPTTPKTGKAKKSAASSKQKVLPARKVKVEDNVKKLKIEDTPKTPKAAGKRKADIEATTESKSKRPKKGGDKGGGSSQADRGDEVSYVGRSVRKDFGGAFYDGSVVKFDKKTNFYKVRYEDGDQEDLELRELEPILVPGRSDIDTDTKPTKLSSLSSLMSQEKSKK